MLKSSLIVSLLSIAALFTRANATPNYAKPAVFIENTGQINDQYGSARNDVHFSFSDNNASVFIGSSAIHYQFYGAMEPPVSEDAVKRNKLLTTMPKAQHIEVYRMDVQLMGADTTVIPMVEDVQSYYEQHIGCTHSPARSCKTIRYRNVYPNIDWVLHIVNDKVGMTLW